MDLASSFFILPQQAEELLKKPYPKHLMNELKQRLSLWKMLDKEIKDLEMLDNTPKLNIDPKKYIKG